ncbi:MAG: hypothetical protein JSV05_00070 [Candidatus Bathyarchaeota archaeon]|nr:MAG: hypothetical protein JSV05_00070 [Candidatus Bathyarchaeota archaeon]
MEPLKLAMKVGGVVAMFLGMVFVIGGANGLAGGTELMFLIGGIVGSPQEAGPILSAVGMLVLLLGVGVTYVSFKLSRLSFLSIILGSISFCIPVILFGLGYNLVAGIITAILGYLFLATIFIWLSS